MPLPKNELANVTPKPVVLRMIRVVTKSDKIVYTASNRLLKKYGIARYLAKGFKENPVIDFDKGDSITITRNSSYEVLLEIAADLSKPVNKRWINALKATGYQSLIPAKNERIQRELKTGYPKVMTMDAHLNNLAIRTRIQHGYHS